MTKTKKILIGVISPLAALLVAFSILCFVTMGMYSSTYLGRVLSHSDSSVSDYYKVFPYRTITASDNPYKYVYSDNTAFNDLQIEYRQNKKNRQDNLDTFVDSTDTMSFIIVKNDNMVYERYANGYGREDINTSFSMSKSVVSLLIGKAIEEGYIESVSQPISDYIEEFTGLLVGRVTIEELLFMRSDIVYDEDKFLWFGDDSLTYWHPNLRKLALEHTKLTDSYNGKFHYNNYHPLLLGMILERSTGVSVSKYFESKIWHSIGAEYDASWSLDSDKSGFEKMESGINFRAIDFIKIGSTVLHGGEWNGAQIFDADWLKLSTLGEPIQGDGNGDMGISEYDYSEYDGTFLANRNVRYNYMWYSYPSPKGGNDILAWGKSDQILYISPDNGTVILRTGKSDGGISNWEVILQKLANADFN